MRRLTALTGVRTQQKEKRGCAQVATSVAAKGQGGVKCLLARRIILLLTGERLCRIDFKSLFVECDICFVPKKTVTRSREMLPMKYIAL